MEKIDDSDPRLVYEPIGDWHTTGSDNEYNDTIHFTGNAGASVTLVFNGTGVGVYGTIAVASNPGGAPITIFSLDDSVDRTEYSAIPPQSTDLYLQRWYFSPPLENGQHTLVASNYLNGASMYLDYFVVTSPTSAPSLQSSSPQSTSPSSTTLGVIVGGVLGGVIIILTAVIILLLARSRRRKAESAEIRTTGRSTIFGPREPTVVPFEAESLLPPRRVYIQPRFAASDSIASNSPHSPSIAIPTRTLVPVHKPGPSISTVASPSHPIMHREDSIAEVPSAPSPEARNFRYDAPPDYGP